MKTLIWSAAVGFVGFWAIYGMTWAEDWRCREKWSASGYEARSHFGCQVKIVPGAWIPESAVRIDQKSK